MLQIATGRLFSRKVSRENRLRGVLFTNVVLPRDVVIETAAGQLLPSSRLSEKPHTVVYELLERIEMGKDGPSVLVSSGMDPYLQDFSVVFSFGLNCVCTPSIDTARRLTSGSGGIRIYAAPKQLVHGVFDNEIWCQQEEVEFFTRFVLQLVRLPRKTFIRVMNSLRTYVNGMHRIADDLELAYTLLVASVESLAQHFDDHGSNWESLDARKRNPIDRALQGSSSEIAERVRAAVLKAEHVALARRFREFAIAHTESAYFREKLLAKGARLARSDLNNALASAYRSRSKYVHELLELPDGISLARDYAESVRDGRETHLTLQGLARLMRNVIITFVMRQPALEKEPYEYLAERAGVAKMRLAPQYWVGHAEGDITIKGRDKLEGFLEQLASCVLQSPEAVLTDLCPVLHKAAGFVSRIGKPLRRPYLALFVLFNSHVPSENRAEMPKQVEALIRDELAKPNSEALIVHGLTSQLISWNLDVHETTLANYFRRRDKKNGLRFPRIFEAAVTLELAERYRVADDLDNCRRVLAQAVENYPGHEGLLELESKFQPGTPIRWQDVMLPATESTGTVN